MISKKDEQKLFTQIIWDFVVIALTGAIVGILAVKIEPSSACMQLIFFILMIVLGVRTKVPIVGIGISLTVALIHSIIFYIWPNIGDNLLSYVALAFGYGLLVKSLLTKGLGKRT
jgi:hypothetical protein